MHHEGFFFQAFIYLLAAVVAVPLAKRLGLGSVLGYLLAGVVIGPFGLKLVGDSGADVMHFAEFGVVMMLFLVGMELRPSLLWQMRGPILGLGGLQVLLTTAAACAIGMLLGLSWTTSLAVGMILALSSTAIVLQTLSEKGLLKSEAGQSCFSVLLFQDIAVIPMLALLPLLAMSPVEPETVDPRTAQQNVESVAAMDGQGEAPDTEARRATHQLAPPSPGRHALQMLGLVAGIILGGRFLARHAFRFIAETRLREAFTAMALLLVIGIALGMQWVGLSPALGTFLAGVVLADNEYRHELESDIEPFKGLLLGLFFISVGASIDFQLLRAQPGMVLGLVTALVSTKAIVLLALARRTGMPWSQSWLFTLALAQGGEFAFVLLSFATGNHVLTPMVADPLVVAVALSMLSTPLLMIVNERVIQPRFRRAATEREPDTINDGENPVIIAGFGRFGQIVGRLLLANGIKTTILESDPAQIEMLRKFDFKVYYGDAGRPDLLHAAGAEQARLFILAVDDPAHALKIAATVRKHFPALPILARARDRVHAFELMEHGVEFMERETFDAALSMGETALRRLGYRGFQAFRMARRFKRHDEEALRATARLRGDEKAYLLASRQYRLELERLLADEQADRDVDVDHAWDTSAARAHVQETGEL